MTPEQVLSARGESLRKESIPPEAKLWHYAEGEVAFSKGAVTYVDLDRAPARVGRNSARRFRHFNGQPA